MIIFYLLMYILVGIATGILYECVLVPMAGRDQTYSTFWFVLLWPFLYLGMLCGLVLLIIGTIKRE